MARTKKTNKVKNKAAVTKKKTAKKKTVAKKTTEKKKTVQPYLVFRRPVYLIPSIEKDFSKKLGYFELCRGEGRIIQTALKYYLEGLENVDETKNKDLIVDRSKSLLNIFQNALKKS